jgi:hypothetical protein
MSLLPWCPLQLYLQPAHYQAVVRWDVCSLKRSADLHCRFHLLFTNTRSIMLVCTIGCHPHPFPAVIPLASGVFDQKLILGCKLQQLCLSLNSFTITMAPHCLAAPTQHCLSSSVADHHFHILPWWLLDGMFYLFIERFNVLLRAVWGWHSNLDNCNVKQCSAESGHNDWRVYGIVAYTYWILFLP